MKLENYIQKLCCFYASDWHLTVMLLPYINNKIDEKSNIYMKCENNIEDKMKILLNKLKIKNEKSILDISWNSKVQEDTASDGNEKIYIISGDEDYIKETNENIEQFYYGREQKIKIINCYEITKGKNLNKIIEENGYTQILNTKGENSITENKAR